MSAILASAVGIAAVAVYWFKVRYWVVGNSGPGRQFPVGPGY